MRRDEPNIEDVLERLLPDAPRSQVQSAGDRVFARLQAERRLGLQPSAPPIDARAHAPWWRPTIVRTAAAVLVLAAVAVGILVPRQGVYAVLEAADGSLYRISNGARVPIRVGDRIGAQETVRVNGRAGAVLALADGSRVELGLASEVWWDHAGDGLTVRLNAGNMIVSAAKNTSGALYVQTRDMTASVAGATSLVNTTDDGSRVAVIEGEAHVHEGATETTVGPGQQVSTSPTLAARPLTESLAWSRHAEAHITAIVAAFKKGMADTAGSLVPERNRTAPPTRASQSVAAVGRQFEEASIRPCDPDNLPRTPVGARGGGANSLLVTPGRLHVLCMTVATLIRTAFRVGHADSDHMARGPSSGRMPLNDVAQMPREDGQRVRGGPEWILTDRYTVEAVAGDASNAETIVGPMLLALLERRFQLKAHIESEQVPAFALTVARGGLKIKPVAPGSCEDWPRPPGSPPPPTPADVRLGAKPLCGIAGSLNGPNQVMVAGWSTLAEFGQMLGMALGRARTVDQTGVTDRFNFVFEFAIDDRIPGVIPLGRQGNSAPADVPRGQTIYEAIEEQLGLQLGPTRTPVQFIVIDHVERPAPN